MSFTRQRNDPKFPKGNFLGPFALVETCAILAQKLRFWGQNIDRFQPIYLSKFFQRKNLGKFHWLLLMFDQKLAENDKEEKFRRNFSSFLPPILDLSIFGQNRLKIEAHSPVPRGQGKSSYQATGCESGKCALFVCMKFLAREVFFGLYLYSKVAVFKGQKNRPFSAFWVPIFFSRFSF